ncbi:MAG: aldehyde oxidase, partial [Desulfobacteraceae bacterium]|nr:aldehyde oxidase [Desulfobacteraceae bacterium]
MQRFQLGFKWINKNIPKIGVRDLARGCKPFSDDIRLPGDALVLKILRSRRSHGRLLGLEVAEALQIPGVIGVLTGKDVPGRNLHGLINKDQPLLAEDKVRFVGEPVAL